MIRRIATAAASAAVAGGLAVSVSPAAAAQPVTERAAHITTLSTSVLAPFQLAFGGNKLYVADGGPGIVSRLDGHTLTPVVAKAPGVTGVAVDPRGDIAYTGGDEATHTSTLTILRAGAKPVVANLSAFEAAHNPDGKVTYGVLHPSQCVKNYFKKIKQPVTYKGDVNSNPYAVTPFRNGWWLVADAGGNDILKVSPKGKVSLVDVLPRQTTVITKAIAKANQLPACAVGVTYYSNPVPTDLQFGPKGTLYVSLLAGGISVGSVYTVDVPHHTSHQLATGFVGATNLAVTPRGVVYVTQAFAGLISRVYRGRTTTVAKLPNVLSLQWGKGVLYAGTAAPGLLQEGNPTGTGSLVKITF